MMYSSFEVGWCAQVSVKALRRVQLYWTCPSKSKPRGVLRNMRWNLVRHRLDLWRHRVLIEIQGEQHGVERGREVAAQLDAEHAITRIRRRAGLGHSTVR